MRLVGCAASLMLALTLAGCGSLKFSQTDCASDPECQAKLKQAADASCEAFQRPPYAIKGATPYDQRWADGNTEAGIGACGWPRPEARPPSLDAPRPAAQQKAAPKQTPPAKVSLRQRVKRFVAPAAVAAPAPEPPVTIVRTTPVPLPPPDPLDELIGPRTR